MEAYSTLTAVDATFQVTVLASSAGTSALAQYLVPYAGMAVAEYLMVVHEVPAFAFIDDLSKHAVAYRELSLLLRRPPGREAFPGEIFFVHSRLLERAAKLGASQGGGSITCFPVIETLAGRRQRLHRHQRDLHHRWPDLVEC